MSRYYIGFQEVNTIYEKILFPTDFSDVATKALKYLKQLKGAGAQEVILLHVIDEKELMVLSRAPAQYQQIVEELKKEWSRRWLSS